MKKALILILLIYTTITVKSQDSIYIETRKYIQKVNIILPSISGEFNLSNSRALSLAYNLGLSFKDIYGDHNEYTYYWNTESKTWKTQLSIYLSCEIRNYITRQGRLRRDKRVDKFSGGYGALKIEGGIGFSENNPHYLEVGPILGFQKALGEVFYWDINAGVGPGFYKDHTAFKFFGSIKFGFAF